MDAARTARRLGAEPLIIYRRDAREMPAHAFEADEALEEGVKIHWLRTIKDIDGTSFTVEVMRLDENRSPQPTGEFETLEADSLILALGQDTDTAFLKQVPGVSFKNDGTVIVGRTCRRTVRACSPAATWCPTTAPSRRRLGTAKRRRAISTRSSAARNGRHRKHEVASFDMLRIWYHAEADAARQSTIESRAVATFDEVVGRSRSGSARYEAQRCLSCGNCFECDGCYSACPEQAVLKLGSRPSLRVRLRQMHRVRDLLTTSVRVARSRWSPNRTGAATDTIVRQQRAEHRTMASRERQRHSMATKRRPRRVRVNEICAIYPITPSSTMGELADQWASEGKTEHLGQRSARR